MHDSLKVEYPLTTQRYPLPKLNLEAGTKLVGTAVYVRACSNLRIDFKAA
jgi:hypothetical protein